MDQADNGKDDEPLDFGVEHNPNGPWARLEDPGVKCAIARLSGLFHGAIRAQDPELSRWNDFLDVFTDAWLNLKAKVEEEAQKYGFTACHTTADLPEIDCEKVAILALTLNGSYLLLGNGCLSHGSFGDYQRIPFRKDMAASIHADEGVRCTSEPTLQESLHCPSQDGLFIQNTSPLFQLYYTTRDLPRGDSIHL